MSLYTYTTQNVHFFIIITKCTPSLRSSIRKWYIGSSCVPLYISMLSSDLTVDFTLYLVGWRHQTTRNFHTYMRNTRRKVSYVWYVINLIEYDVFISARWMCILTVMIMPTAEGNIYSFIFGNGYCAMTQIWILTYTAFTEARILDLLLSRERFSQGCNARECTILCCTCKSHIRSAELLVEDWWWSLCS